MNADITKFASLQEHQSDTSESLQKIDLSAKVFEIVSLLANKKYAQAFAQSTKHKFSAFQELTKIVYEYGHLRYLLMSKDKILQVCSEPHLLTQTGMVHLRTLAIYREEAGQAKNNYQAITENIKKLLTSSSNYYQCTLPNRQELGQLKNSLNAVFQELKILRKQKPLSASQATQNQRAKIQTTINTCKKGILELINQIVPSMIMKQSTNREKTIQQLINLSKELIKQAICGFRNQMELLRSRTLISEKVLESERLAKLQNQRQIQQLKEELLSSKQMIEDLQGMKAATEMENLGLHSKIQTAESDEEREIFQAEIERLRLEVDEWTNNAIKAKESEAKWREDLQNISSELERQREKSLRFLITCKSQEEENIVLKQHIFELSSKQSQMQSKLSHYESDLMKTQLLLKESTETLQSNIQQCSQLKIQNNHYLAQLLKLQSSHQNHKQLFEEYHKLQEEFEHLQADNSRLYLCLHQQEQKRSAYENLIEELSRLNEEGQQDKQRLSEELETCISDNQHFRDIAGMLQAKLKELQEDYEYLTAEKDYYANSYHACNSRQQAEQEDAIHT